MSREPGTVSNLRILGSRFRKLKRTYDITGTVSDTLYPVDHVGSKMASLEPVEAVSFAIGEQFLSYEVLEEKIKRYEQQQCIQLYKRDCRSISSAARRTDKVIRPELKYHDITYCCVNGGQKYKAKGVGKRNTRCDDYYY